MQNFPRREFLGGGLMASLAMACPSLLRAAGEGGKTAWQPKPALSSVMFSHLKLEDFCTLAAKLGFKAIDLWGPFDNCRHMIEAAEMGSEKFLALLKQHDLKIGVWTCYRHQKNEKVFNDFAEFIGACGGGIVVRGTQYEGTHKSKLEGSITSFYDKIADQIELAKTHKCRIALENHAYAILDSPWSFELFTKHNPAPELIGFSIAPYHLQRRKADVAQVIRDHGDQLLFFYAWQLGEGSKQLPGHGPVDFTPWLKALKDVGYGHWMTPFMHGEMPEAEMAAAVSKAVTYLQQTSKSIS